MRIAISGCGITGTAVAFFLAKAGHDVVLFEQAPQCQPVGAGILLQPSGQAVLKEMDLLEDVESCSARLVGMSARLTSGRDLVNLNYDALDPGFYGLGVHRGRLFERLLKACQTEGAQVVNSAIVSGFTTHQSSGGESTIEITTAESSESYGKFDFLIAADGSRSSLRKACEIPTRIVDYDYAALWLTGQSKQQPDRLVQTVKGSQILIGMLPIGQNEFSYFWGLPVPTRDSTPTDQLGDFESWREEAIRLCPGSSDLLLSLEDFSPFTFAKYRHVHMKSCYAGKVIFLGDAAHATSPHLGQGANLGLEDALCFARILAAESTLESTFRKYAQTRRRKIRYYQQLTRILSPFFQSRGTLKAFARDVALPWLPYLPFVRKQMLRTLCGTKNGWLA